jgi:hypothetical protein
MRSSDALQAHAKFDSACQTLDSAKTELSSTLALIDNLIARLQVRRSNIQKLLLEAETRRATLKDNF